jgi:protein ImuB
MPRFVVIHLRYFKTDWHACRQPALATLPFVLYNFQRGKMVVTAANQAAEAYGIAQGSLVADAKALQPQLRCIEETPNFFAPKLAAFAAWCIGYAPVVALQAPLGVVLDATGCAHLWGGEQAYLRHLSQRLLGLGYSSSMAIADTIGAAWALAHFKTGITITPSCQQASALATLPPAALRLEAATAERLHKLGFNTIQQLLQIPASALNRRFGAPLLRQIQLALGYINEHINPVDPPPQYQERLPCLEPISTAKGIGMALQRLLNTLCKRLSDAQTGLRTAIFKGFRIDGAVETIALRVTVATNNPAHLQRLFELKIPGMMPAGGIELFTIEAQDLGPAKAEQGLIWHKIGELTHPDTTALVDQLATKIGFNRIARYLPQAFFIPEMAQKNGPNLDQNPEMEWPNGGNRPVLLLPKPKPIAASGAAPQSAPTLFNIDQHTHRVVKSDGPERLCTPWWRAEAQQRDYYHVEDENGSRYWLFKQSCPRGEQWFLHGYCA